MFPLILAGIGIAAAGVASGVIQKNAADKAAKAVDRQAEAVRQAGEEQARLYRELADLRAASVRELAELRARLLEAAGVQAETLGAYNQAILQQQRDLTAALADRALGLLQIERTLDERALLLRLRTTMGETHTALAASGARLEGTPLLVLMDQAARADYALGVFRWQTEVAVQNLRLGASVEDWALASEQQRVGYLADLEAAQRQAEALLTQRVGALAAQAELQEGEFAALSAILQANAGASGLQAEATGIRARGTAALWGAILGGVSGGLSLGLGGFGRA